MSLLIDEKTRKLLRNDATYLQGLKRLQEQQLKINEESKQNDSP